MKAITKNIAVYFLLVLFLGNAVKVDFFEQLEKIPQLIGHYKHHVIDEGEQISFYDFLVLHYDENSKHKQEEEHSNLPLYSHCFSHCLTVLVTSLAQPEFAQYFTLETLHTPFNFNYIFIGTSGIFQPPKLV